MICTQAPNRAKRKYSLFAEGHHSVDHSGHKHQTAAEQRSQSEAQDHRRKCNSKISKSKSFLKSHTQTPLKYSHTVQGGPVPVRPLVGLLRHLLHVVEEDEAAGRLYREHHEADEDLEDSADQAAHVTEQDADAVPQAEQDADWNGKKNHDTFYYIETWRN